MKGFWVGLVAGCLLSILLPTIAMAQAGKDPVEDAMDAFEKQVGIAKNRCFLANPMAGNAISCKSKTPATTADCNIVCQLLPGSAPFGVFPPKSMAPIRCVAIVEVTWDGAAWHELEYTRAPTRPTHRPRFIAPHLVRWDQLLIYETFGTTEYALAYSVANSGIPYGHATFSDTEFNDSDWTLTQITPQGMGSISAMRGATGGSHTTSASLTSRPSARRNFPSLSVASWMAPP